MEGSVVAAGQPTTAAGTLLRLGGESVGARSLLAFGLGVVAALGTAYALVGTPFSSTARRWSDVDRRAERRGQLASWAILGAIFALSLFAVAAGGWSLGTQYTASGEVFLVSTFVWGAIVVVALSHFAATLLVRDDDDGLPWRVAGVVLGPYVLAGILLPEWGFAQFPAPSRPLLTGLLPGYVLVVVSWIALTIVITDLDSRRPQTRLVGFVTDVLAVLPVPLALAGVLLVAGYPYHAVSEAFTAPAPVPVPDLVWPVLAATGLQWTLFGARFFLSTTLRHAHADEFWDLVQFYGPVLLSTAVVVWPGFVTFDTFVHGQFFAAGAVAGLAVGTPIRYRWVGRQERVLASDLVERTRRKLRRAAVSDERRAEIRERLDRAEEEVRDDPAAAVRTARTVWHGVEVVPHLETAGERLDEVEEAVAAVEFVDDAPFRPLREAYDEIYDAYRQGGSAPSDATRAENLTERIDRRLEVTAYRSVAIAGAELTDWHPSRASIASPAVDHDEGDGGVSVVTYHERIRERVVAIRSQHPDPVTVRFRDTVNEHEWEDGVSAEAGDLPEACTFDPTDGVTCTLDLEGGENRVLRYEASRELRRRVPEAEVTGGSAPAVEVFSGRELVGAVDEFRDYAETRTVSEPGSTLAHACEALEEERFVDALRRVRDAQLASKPEVDSLLSAAKQDADAAASAFDEDDYDTAIERWQDAREKYERARAQLATRDEPDLEAKVESSLERVASNVADCKLARGATKVDAAEKLVGERSKRASATFEDALDYLDTLDVDREAQIDALETRAQEGRLRSLIDVGRSRMETAEREYDAGRLDEAKATFRDAKEFFRNVSDLAIEYAQPEFRREAGSLVDACVENVEQINTELTRVEGVSPEIERVEEVPSQGRERSDAVPSVRDGRREYEFDRERFVRRTDRDGVGASPPAHERLGQVGEGGQARVFRVRLEESGTVAALKVAKYRGTVGRDHVRRFLDSAEQWSLVDDHEHVVSVYDWGFGSDLWLLQEYVGGGDLTERTGRVSVERGAEILAGIADALQYARGVDHLDVKPANVLVDGDGTAKLADWGLARVAFDHEHTNTRLGLSPPYAAPEQVDRTLGRRDNLTDIYQLGVTGYELLTGELPFDPEAGPSLEQRILEVEPEPPSHHDPSIPAELDEVILTAMAKDREDRYEAALEFRNALEDVTDGP